MTGIATHRSIIHPEVRPPPWNTLGAISHHDILMRKRGDNEDGGEAGGYEYE